MSTWGIDHFDNDVAADFIGDFEESNETQQLEMLHKALTAVVNASGWIGGADAQEAIASAAIIAATLSKGHGHVRAGVKQEEVSRRYSQELVDLATAAIVQVLSVQGDLSNDWEERGKLDSWRSSLDHLLVALGYQTSPDMDTLWSE